ncbi:MAG: ROK family protein [Oscillospiraceae bacterium]|nr:ROK family protein [Oscillospiraceae bacterium]
MFVGAFDIGGTKTIVALADETGKVYEKLQFPTDTSDCLKHLDQCCEIFQGFLENRGIAPGEISGIGVNLPGLVDCEKGILIRAVYAGWNNIPVKEHLSRKLQIDRIVCENDVNSCAIGELKFGLGKQFRSFGWMTVSTGVGGAVVCDGKLLRGAHGYAGEFGHIKVEYVSPQLCPCGEYGCLEAHGSGTALNRLIKEQVQKDLAFDAAFEALQESPSGVSCAKLAKSGNETAQAIFCQVGEYLGRGIACYTNILDPDAVIIGGGVSASLDLLMPGIRKSLEQYTFAQMKDVKILPTALGYEAALMGAIAIAL